MYSIFHPLDANERLPGELVNAGRRHRFFEVRFMEMAGFVYLPALVLGVVLLASAGVSPLVAFGLAGLAFAAFFVWVVAGRYR
jgi:hypothetical protein